MALTFSTQTSIAFKNLSGKSMTDIDRFLGNEPEGIFLNVDSSKVWTSLISPTPSIAISNGVAIAVTASLVLDNGSNGHAYFAVWPQTPPSGMDPLTFTNYTYGSGLLLNVFSGSRVVDSIPPQYGNLYGSQLYDISLNSIPIGDPRDWIYQYQSGVYYQQDNVGSDPGFISVFSYFGNTLAEQDVSPQYNNIRVSVIGVDSYTGSSNPIISTYSINDIYLVDFSNTNTGVTAVTLDINGLGSYEVIKYNISGPVGLTAGSEITPSQVYYLTWDGSEFQLYDSYPVPTSALLYTNVAPVPTTIGGISTGMTFSDLTMKQMWDLLLYPYQLPSFTSFSFNHGGLVKEVGDDIIGGTYSFTWTTQNSVNIQTDSIIIEDLTDSIVLVSGTSNDDSEYILLSTIAKTQSGNHQWRISALNSNSVTFNEYLNISWLWRRYSGTQSLGVLNSTEVASLSNDPLESNRLGNYTFGPVGYKYFAWPTSFGSPNLFRDYNTNLAVAMAGVPEGYTQSIGSYYGQIMSVNNTWGKSTDYYVFRTLNVLGGSINIVVT